MGKTFLRTNLALLCIIVLLVSCGAASDSSGSFVNGAASNGTRWNSNVFPIDLRVASSFDAAEITAVGDMADEWTTAVENQITFFQSVTTTPNLEYTNTDNYNDSVQAIYELDTWPSAFPTTALAVTQLFALQSNGGLILTHADILINEEYYNFSTNPSDFGNYDYPTVVLHELGHFLGLGHESFSTPSVMQPSVSKIDANRDTTNADRGNIAENYGLSTSYSQFATLTAGDISPIVAGASAAQDGPVKIVLQLMEDGECQHIIDEEIVHSHHVEL